MKKMTKDEAVDIAHTVHKQTLEELIENYKNFHAMVEVTPSKHFIEDKELIWDTVPKQEARSHQLMRGLHAAIGMSTEAAEILDAYKKFMYGKRREIREQNLKEELGDMWFYFFLLMSAFNINFKDVIAHNVEKLANRYIEKFEE